MSGNINPRFTSLSFLNTSFFHPPVLLAKLSFLALSRPPLLLFLAECPTGTGLLRPCPVSTHHRISPVTAISPHSFYTPLTHQSRRAPRQSPISTGAPMSTCAEKPLFSLTEPQSFPSVSFHLLSRPSENSYVYESM